MEVGRNETKYKLQLSSQSSVDGIGIAKYSLVTLMCADMKMKVPFVSKTVGMINFISSLILFVL